MQLLTLSNPKVAKGALRGVLTAILHLAPFTLSGRNVCPWASAGCAAACLNTAGRGAMSKIQEARVRKTRAFYSDREGFVTGVMDDISRLVRKADGRVQVAVRLNGTSDLPWFELAPRIFHTFEDVQFYDYTKSYRRMCESLGNAWPMNYHLTFSRSETNERECLDVLARGGNVAVVFDTRKGAPLPEEWNGFPVIDGDVDDVRFHDGRGVVVGLRAKGKAKKDNSGFVVKG